MKKFLSFLRSPLTILCMIACALALDVIFNMPALAQTVPPPVEVPGWLAPIAEFLKQFLVGFVTKYTWFAAIVAFVGSARVVIKPILSLVRIVVTQTPSKSDDEFLDRWEKSKVWAVFLYVLDWLASLKPGQKT